MEIANNNPFIMQQFAARNAVRQKDGRRSEEFDDFVRPAQESGAQKKADAAKTRQRCPDSSCWRKWKRCVPG